MLKLISNLTIFVLMELPFFSQTKQLLVSFGNKGSKVITHPLGKEALIFSIFLALIGGGTALAFIYSQSLIPIKAISLAGKPIWILQTVSMGERVKAISLILIGGGLSGVGTYGLLNRGVAKTLALKGWLDGKVAIRNNGQEDTYWYQKTVTWFFINAKKGIDFLHVVKKILDNRYVKIMEYTIGVALIVGGLGILILCIHYFISLSQFASGVIGEKTVTGLLVSGMGSKVAILSMSRGVDMASGLIVSGIKDTSRIINQFQVSYIKTWDPTAFKF